MIHRRERHNLAMFGTLQLLTGRGALVMVKVLWVAHRRGGSILPASRTHSHITDVSLDMADMVPWRARNDYMCIHIYLICNVYLTEPTISSHSSFSGGVSSPRPCH